MIKHQIILYFSCKKLLLRIPRIRKVQIHWEIYIIPCTCKNGNLIPHIFRLCTVSFHVFTEYIKFHYVCLEKTPQNNSGKIILQQLGAVFKWTVLHKRSEGQQLNLKPIRNKLLYWSSFTKKFFRIFCFFAGWAQIRISWRILTYIQTSLGH